MSVLKCTILFVLISIISCNKSDNNECPEDLACTAVFVSINVKIVNSFGEIVTLTKTVTAIEGQLLPIENTDFKSIFNGYTILDDSQTSKIQKGGSNVIFTAYNEKGQEIAKENYVIGHDCCHVFKISGPETIIIN